MKTLADLTLTIPFPATPDSQAAGIAHLLRIWGEQQAGYAAESGAAA